MEGGHLLKNGKYHCYLLYFTSQIHPRWPEKMRFQYFTPPAAFFTESDITRERLDGSVSPFISWLPYTISNSHQKDDPN
jgi:hypothetical protein